MALPLTASAALRYWNMARQRHCRRLARNGKPAASLLTPSSNQLPRPARKAGFSTFESRSGRETDCLLEGDGFELPVPRTTPGFWPISTRTTRRDRCRKKGVRIRQLLVFAALGAGVVGSAAVCAFRFRPPGTGSKRAGWRRSGAFFGAVCFEPDASRWNQTRPTPLTIGCVSCYNRIIVI